MADVQLEHGYLRLANRLATALALAPWDAPSQQAMLMALIRCSYGMRRRDAELSTTEWCALTGLSERNLIRIRKRLHAEGVIELVRDFDARAQRGQTWALQKDFTKWGCFAVEESAVDGAESIATRERTPVTREAPPDTHDRGDPLTPVSPDPLTRMSPDPLTRTSGGTGPNPANDNDLQRRKTGKTGKTPINKKRATQLPADWSPTDQHRELARELRVDVELEAEKMRDWAAAKGATGIDWDARFRNWLRNATPTANGNGHRSHGQRQQRGTPQQFDYSNATTEFRGFAR